MIASWAVANRKAHQCQDQSVSKEKLDKKQHQPKSQYFLQGSANPWSMYKSNNIKKKIAPSMFDLSIPNYLFLEMDRGRSARNRIWNDPTGPVTLSAYSSIYSTSRGEWQTQQALSHCQHTAAFTQLAGVNDRPNRPCHTVSIQQHLLN